jgi:hypothetical protein
MIGVAGMSFRGSKGEVAVLAYVTTAGTRMDLEAEQPSETKPTSLGGLVLISAAVGCVVAGGLLLWGHRGDAIFSDMILTGLAWCF